MTTKPKKQGADGGKLAKVQRLSRAGSSVSFAAVGPAGMPGVLARTTLKKAGGSLIVTVPARARDALHLSEGQEMTVVVDGQKLVLEPTRALRPVYALEELLAQCDFDQPYSDEERAWLDAAPVGRELL